MPDFKISSNGKDVLYFEFKVIFRPFITISRKVNSSFECYSHSLTLDAGEKLKKQKEEVTKVGTDKVFYVYWYDLPCVKGVFWTTATKVYAFWDDQTEYSRKIVRGDFSSWGNKVGTTSKIYLPLCSMDDFSSFFIACKRASAS